MDFLPTSALVRKELRSRIRDNWRNNNRLRHFLMGELGKFSAIQVSHFYWNGKNWEFRIWGMMLKNSKNIFGVSREDILNFIKKNDEFWKEMLSG